MIQFPIIQQFTLLENSLTVVSGELIFQKLNDMKTLKGITKRLPVGSLTVVYGGGWFYHPMWGKATQVPNGGRTEKVKKVRMFIIEKETKKKLGIVPEFVTWLEEGVDLEVYNGCRNHKVHGGDCDCRLPSECKEPVYTVIEVSCGECGHIQRVELEEPIK